jgi:tRNA-2-methylthio-N6-dimethylallyladenosine synthase
VASPGRRAIVARAPYVDLVFGPQTLHRLPQLIAQRRATGRSQVDILSRDREVRPPAAGSGRRIASAFVSIMEGCSKYCTFCVVPYTRGEEVSRPLDDVLAEVSRSGRTGRQGDHAAGTERQCLAGRAGARHGGTSRLRLPARMVHEIPGVERMRYTTSHPREMTQRVFECLREDPQAGRPSAPAGAVRIGPGAGGDEARPFGARIQVGRAEAARRNAPTCRCRRTSSSVFRARPRRISRRR